MKLSRVNVAVLSALVAGFVHAEPDVSTFEEVVVTANKYEESLSKTAGSVSVIEGEEIRKSGATELYEVLKNEPGVSVTGSAGTAQNIAIRGMTGNRISVVKDGIAASDGYGANDINDVAGHNSFDIASAKAIQVVKGASSTSFGSGAIGGVVIVESLAPEDFLKGETFYVDASTNYASNSHRYRLASNLAFALGDTESLVQAAYWNGDETKSYDDNRWRREIEGLTAAYTINHYLNDAWLLKAKADFYRERVERNEGEALIQFDSKMEAESYFEENTTSTYLFWLGAEYEADALLLDTLDTKIYYRSTEFSNDKNVLMYRDEGARRIWRREIENRVFNDQLIGWSADLTKEIDFGHVRNTFVYGAKLETTYHDRPVDESIAEGESTKDFTKNSFAPATSYSLGAFLQDSIEFGNWRAMLGLRFDAYRLLSDDANAIAIDGIFDDKSLPSNNSSEVSPSASLAYQFTPTFNSYISYKHGYRAPEYAKTYGLVDHSSIGAAGFILMPNFELQEETSDSFEIGAKYDDGKLRIYGAAFYNIFNNFIDVGVTGYDKQRKVVIQTYENLDGVKTYGAEASAEYLLASAISARTSLGIVDGKDKDGEYVRVITPLQGNASLNYDDGQLNGYLRLNWADSMTRTTLCQSELGIEEDCAQTAGWATLDAGVGYHFDKRTHINLNIFNLFDRKYVMYEDIAGQTNAQKEWAYASGRYFTINARYAF